MRRNIPADQAGQSLVEFAALATVLFMLVMAILEFSRAFYYYSSIQNAAQEGARLGITTGVNTTAKQTAIISRTVQSAVAVDGISSSNVSIACPGGCGSVGAGGMFTVTVNYTFTAVTGFVPSFQLRGQSSMMIDHSP